MTRRVMELTTEARETRQAAALVVSAAIGVAGVEPILERLRAYPEKDLGKAAVVMVEKAAAVHRAVERELAMPERQRASAA